MSPTALFEGETRRLRRSLRASHSIEHCLHSLRIPLVTAHPPPALPTTSITTMLALRAQGSLYTNEMARTYIRALDEASRSDRSTPEFSYAASVVLDTWLPYWHVHPAAADDFAIEPLNPICEASLPDHQAALHDVVWSVNTVIYETWRHLIMKLLPRAGNPRRFINILIDYMATAATRRDVVEIIACGLLGNYRHCPARARASLATRLCVYSVCMPVSMMKPIGPNMTRHFEAILGENAIDLLSLFALREYLVFLIDDDPVLRSHVSDLFNYDQFRTVVIDAMNDVRVYIHENVRAGAGNEECTMHEATIGNGVHVTDIENILAHAYGAVVRLAYRKPRPSPLELLHSVRGKIPPTLEWARVRNIPVHYFCEPTSDEKGSATRRVTRAKRLREEGGGGGGGGEDGGGEKDDDDDEPAPAKRNRAVNTLLIELERGGGGEGKRGGGGGGGGRGMEALLRLGALLQQDLEDKSNVVVAEEEEKEKKKEEEEEEGPWRARGPGEKHTEESVEVTRDCVTVTHSRDLASVITRLPSQGDPMEAWELITEYLEVVGASSDGLEAHRLLAREQHFDGAYTLRAWEERLCALRGMYPYTYALIQTAAAMWTRHTSIRRMPLPHHYVVAQTRALAQRYGVTPTAGSDADRERTPDCIPEQPCRFAFCRVCGRVYSVIRRAPVVSRRELKRPKPVPTHGFVDAAVNLLTGAIYCSKSRALRHERCGQRPLAQVAILGHELVYRRASYVICTQPNCGQIAIMHPTNTTTTEYGIACHRCTLAIRERKMQLPPELQAVIDHIRQRRHVRKHNRPRLLASSSSSSPSKEKAKQKKEEDEEEEEEEEEEVKKGEGREEKEEEESGEIRCFICNRLIKAENKMVLYGLHTFTCERHPRYKMCGFVTTGLASMGYSHQIGVDERAEAATQTLLLKFVVAHRELFARVNERIRKAMRARVREAEQMRKIMR